MPAIVEVIAAMRAELKAAFRAIANRASFSALVVAVLGVGLACTIFMLVMVNTFVLRPLLDIAPDWRHPVLKRTARTLWQKRQGAPEGQVMRKL